MDNQMINDLQKSLKKAMKGLDRTLANLPDEAKQQIPSAIADVNRIKSALKSGNTSIIEEITQRYADINNK